MSKTRPPKRPVRPATPAPAARSQRPLRPMPRQDRPAPPPARAARRRPTVLGVPWPLPISPAVTGLLLALIVAGGAAWYFEGRYETPPAEAAKLLLPYQAADVQQVLLTTPEGSATYSRDASGKLTTGGPTPVPTPTPGPGATPAPVVLAPSTKLESLLNQLHDLRVDRVVLDEPSASPDFGLDKPQLTLTVTPKRGAPATLAVGQLSPDRTAYYVRREDRRDTVLVSKYTLEDLIKVAGDVIRGE